MSSETVSNAFCFAFYFNLIFSFGSCLNAESLMVRLLLRLWEVMHSECQEKTNLNFSKEANQISIPRRVIFHVESFSPPLLFFLFGA